MRQCNNCARKCDRMALHRNKVRRLSLEELQSNCPRHIPPPPMSTTLLNKVLDKNPQAFMETLDAFDLRFSETNSPPYFRIYKIKKKGNRY